MRCSAIYDKLKEVMPLDMAMEWDNPGMLVGTADKEVKSVFIALDATTEAIDEAIGCHADLMITHHPLIFSSIKSVTDESIVGKRIERLIESGITLICMHTNYDVAPGCMADITAGMLGISGEPLMVTGEIDGKNIGVGKVGELQKPCSMNDLITIIKQKFGLNSVTVWGDSICDEPITRIAISPGSGKGMSSYAINAGAQVLITGDISHHDGLDAIEDGLCIIDAGHYGIEHVMVDDMEHRLHDMDASLKIHKQAVSIPSRVI